MKIYVITRGCYSDYHICAVSTDIEQAEFLAKRFTDSCHTAEIEEYDTDDYIEHLKYEHMYDCMQYENGKISVYETSFGIIDSPEDFRVKHHINNSRGINRLIVYVNADTEEQALKIASDKFAQYIAEQMDL